jgi:hypothetical protein
LQGSSLDSASLFITINDIGYPSSGIADTSMTITRNPAGAGGSPNYDRNASPHLTGIDLRGLTSTDHYLWFDFASSDNAGNTANFRVVVKPKIANPSVLGAFDVTYTTLGSTAIILPAAGDAHGANAPNAQLCDENFWKNTLGFNPSSPPAGQEYAKTAWNFGPVSQGWPVLANVGGQ